MPNLSNIFIPCSYHETRNGIEYVTLPSELFKARKLYLVDEVTPVSMGVLLQSLMCLEDISDEPVELYINSRGGEVSSGMAVYRYITEQMQSPVHTYCIGLAASMAAILYLAGERRYIYDGCQIMIHAPASISGNAEKPEELKDRLEILESTKSMACRIIADRTGRSIDEIAEITQKDKYFNADEALEYGLATYIIRRKEK